MDRCQWPRCNCSQGCGHKPAWASTFVLSNHGKPCTYCGTEMRIESKNHMPTRDHVIPRAKGGPDDMANIVPACSYCNQHKDNRTLEEWHAELMARGATRWARRIAMLIVERSREVAA